MEPFINPAVAIAVRRDFHRLFLTAKEIQGTHDITFKRRDPDLGSVNIEVTDVMFTLAARQADFQRGGGTVTTMTQGQVARETPFPIQAGDTFVLNGVAGRVVVVYPAMNDIIRADVFFNNPYG